MSDIVYLNGSLIPLSQARVPVMDYGFLYGFSLFETMRAYRGRAFRLDRHLERLARSAGRLGIQDVTPGLKDAVESTIQANKLTDARIRITVSVGEGSTTPDPASCRRPTVLIAASEYHPFPEEVYQRGFKAIISSARRNSLSPLSRLKTGNYLESLLARQEARQAGSDEAICLNEKGLVAEASMSNVFLVIAGALATPKEENGILPGVTREAVLEMATRLNIGSTERDITPEEIFQAQEVFLTNSLMEIMPLTEMVGKSIGGGKPGPVTVKMMGEYKKMVLASRAA